MNRIEKIAGRIASESIDFEDLVKELKNIGFSAKIKRMSWGPHLVVVDNKGEKLPSIFTRETLEYWKPAIGILKSHARDNVMFRGTRVTKGG